MQDMQRGTDHAGLQPMRHFVTPWCSQPKPVLHAHARYRLAIHACISKSFLVNSERARGKPEEE